MNKFINRFLTIAVLVIAASFSFSQQYLDINYPGRTTPLPATAPVSLYSCEASPEIYSVKIDNISPFILSNMTFTFKLPAGIVTSGVFSGRGSSSLSSFTDSTLTIDIDSLIFQEIIILKLLQTVRCTNLEHLEVFSMY